MREDDRITSFSIKPYDEKSLDNLKWLKNHSKNTGISFSHLLLTAMNYYVEGLKNK